MNEKLIELLRLNSVTSQVASDALPPHSHRDTIIQFQ